jgi:hypothetical protein
MLKILFISMGYQSPSRSSYANSYINSTVFCLKKFKTITKLKGNVVTDVGWNKSRGSMLVDSILIGTQKGTFFEISLGEDGKNPTDSNCKQEIVNLFFLLLEVFSFVCY